MFIEPGKHSGVDQVDAKYLTIEGLRTLVKWCNSEREDYWLQDDGHALDLQGILDTHHAASEWESIDAWLDSENPQRSEARAVWKSICQHSRERAKGNATREIYEWMMPANPTKGFDVPCAVRA